MIKKIKDREAGVKIDKGIPIPPRSKKSIYPWLDMEVGDSFAFLQDTKNWRTSCYALVGQHNRKFAPKKWIARAIDDGVRCWRVK